MRPTLICACLFLPATPPSAMGEEAVDLTGRRWQGQLVHEKATWLFRDDAGKAISVKDLSHIRFEPKASLPPSVPLSKTLMLPGGQRLTGSLLKLDEQSLDFTNVRGKTHVLPRNQLVGVAHADDWLPVVYEDFETPLKTWKVQGSAELVAKVRFFGSQSMKLSAADQVLTREWPTLRDGRITLVFAKLAREGRWTIELLARDLPTVKIDGDGVHSIGVRDDFGALKVCASWHSLVIEWEAAVLRIYVNDRCLGQTPLPAKSGVAGIRFATKQTGDGLFIDEITVARRMRTLPIPKSDLVQDSLWFEHGEQLFGRIVSADQRSVTFDAKFGKRTFQWSQLRGIGFADGKRTSPESAVEVEFRPGPGCSADRLLVKLLRWDDTKLIAEHAALGEIAIERERLETVRFAVK